ncbi:hypothetical protein [Sorangium atrum]|uniref:DUF4388 domain-containing protein n=1 Tax=Sorangium atrum TaxID=2995308 RepID=A0ABT5CBN2_9BACT|nr:hypothetical protein [Sorangium aterium]MDC0683230.1 hypothetical protein [Sorangium aterium]
MSPDGLATAEGDLERTPFAHLFVYAVEHRLTGALILVEPTGAAHTLRIVRGNPVKIRPSDGYARLGEILIEEGVITAEILAEALATRGLLGDVLLLSGCVDAATIDWLAQVQFVRRMMRLFDLPPETKYRYFDGIDALAEWGGDPAKVDPLALLWAGLREHGERSTRLQRTLERIGAVPLRLHPALEPGRFGFREGELAVIEALESSTPTLAALLRSGVAPEPIVRKLIYALAITRYLDFGTGGPVGAELSSSVPPASAASLSLGRVQLRATVHRVGAAAPDPAGDGERAPVLVRGRRRDRPSSEPSPVSTVSTVTGASPLSGGSLSAAVAAELASAAGLDVGRAAGEPSEADGDREPWGSLAPADEGAAGGPSRPEDP